MKSTALAMNFSRTATTMGLALAILSLVALTGPGRIDIADGQARYEVARSLLDHGDSVIRDPHIWYARFSGRGGQDYTTYRFPQSVLGVPAIWLSDLTSSHPIEARRHFFFSLTGALSAAMLAWCYLAWFRQVALNERSAVAWAALGIVATPAWFYATSTFDDILGATAVTAAVVASGAARSRDSQGRAVLAGLLLGLAFNCKQPLGLFGIAVVAAADNVQLPGPRRVARGAIIAAGLAVGVMAYLAYDLYKFPPDLQAVHAAQIAAYPAAWPGHPAIALFVFAVSPSAGVFWYCPPLLLCLIGLREWKSQRGGLVSAVVISAALFVGFIASMSIFKGDPSWGPRYLTPVFSLLWLFAPAGAIRQRSVPLAAILAAGVAVQVAALAVDSHRLYVERNLHSGFGFQPFKYFDSANAHLLNRPREILEIWRAREAPVEAFSPASSPTFAFPILDEIMRGPEVVRRYRILNTFRPWWASQCYLPIEQRPVPIAATVELLSLTGVAGIGLCLWGIRASGSRRPE